MLPDTIIDKLRKKNFNHLSQEEFWERKVFYIVSLLKTKYNMEEAVAETAVRLSPAASIYFTSSKEISDTFSNEHLAELVYEWWGRENGQYQ